MGPLSEHAARALLAAANVESWFELVGPNHAVALFGVRLVGVNAENGKKLVLTCALLAALTLAHAIARLFLSALAARRREPQAVFWIRQSVHIGLASAAVLGVASIWFDDPTRLATALGLVTAGLAFALQKVVAAIAGYVVILRGKTFNVGDRIVMGGVRGDVIALSFTQTTIMEMGQPAGVQGDEPAMWIRSRQYTGRIVTVSNARIFDEPVYNYSQHFPYLWEELRLSVWYSADRARAESILLEVAERNTVDTAQLGESALQEMQRRYFVQPSDVRPRVYFRMTDAWLELTVRFVVSEHGVREVKDRMTRELLERLDAAGIAVAGSSIALSQLAPLEVQLREPPSKPSHRRREAT